MNAIVLGATGLVGSKLLETLLANEHFEKVRIFTRRTTGLNHSKLEEYIVDFDQPETWRQMVIGDILYSAFGTTIKKAGSKEKQYRIDYSYQYEMAAAAAANGVKTYVLVSAAFSNPRSRIFYSRIKGELERDVYKLPFDRIHILRPGILDGERHEHRAGERAGISLMKILSLVPGLNYMKPIRDRQVARAMINASLMTDKGIHIYQPKALFALAGN